MEVKYRLQKPYTDEQRTDFIVTYNHNGGLTINETGTELQALGLDDEELLEQAKEDKLNENESKRDAFMIAPVIYNGIAFDCDMEQSQNLDFQERHMTDEDVVDWLAYDGITVLKCTKQDIQNLGMLIIAKRKYVWTVKNPQIKLAIQNATTVEEVKAIKIDYNSDELNA